MPSMIFYQVKPNMNYINRRYWMQSILTISMMAFYFFKHNSFITYQTIGTNCDCMTHKNAITQRRVLVNQLFQVKKLLQNQFISRKGIYAYQITKLIVMNMRKSIEFDEAIVLDPILPVLIQLIIYDNYVIAVFEVPIQQRNFLKYEKGKIMLCSSTIVGLDQCLEMMAAKFRTTIMNAINILKLQ
ncbi:unnamed protein product [Paramecium pentaurelia]|uniref:Transmembrane protein n=1 Tax=Paramecium pentaurelia TaxID=43138 RepID=A0A8S1T6Q2_9CILI|nr:unnamed protein product [Paramecium pentaurelia]